jgi:hypothetical protein
MLLHPKHLPDTKIIDLSTDDARTLRRMLREEWVRRTLKIAEMSGEDIRDLVDEIDLQDPIPDFYSVGSAPHSESSKAREAGII